MPRSMSLFALALLATVACANSAEARRGARHVSDDGSFSFQVEIDGYAAPIYSASGQSWVEGVYGRSYAIRVFNHTAERVEAVVTVDGRDVVSGQSGDYRKQRGYVIDPYDSVLIDGFRQSYQNVASFYFTSPGDAYATRMGDSRNLGIIGVAIFRERKPYVPSPPPIAYDRPREYGSGYGGTAKSAPAPSSGAMSNYEAQARDDVARSQSLGTGYGQSTYSPATTTKFVRRSPRRPDALLSIRYDDRQGLIDNGVLPQPYYPPYQPAPQPFPSAQPQFAPPPPPPNPPPPWYWE